MSRVSKLIEMQTNARKEKYNATHPGFTVTCNECGSDEVYVDNTVGFSSISGMWGSVDLICANCGNSVAVFE